MQKSLIVENEVLTLKYKNPDKNLLCTKTKRSFITVTEVLFNITKCKTGKYLCLLISYRNKN